MEAKYNQAIKAGIIGGIVLIILALVDAGVTLSGVGVLQAGLGCIVFLLVILAAGSTGALAVKYARESLKSLGDACGVAAISGLIAGVLYAIAGMLTSVVTAAAAEAQVTKIMSMWGVPASYGNYGAGPGWVGQCCCEPFIVLIVVILAVIGGALYAALVAKIQ